METSNLYAELTALQQMLQNNPAEQSTPPHAATPVQPPSTPSVLPKMWNGINGFHLINGTGWMGSARYFLLTTHYSLGFSPNVTLLTEAGSHFSPPSSQAGSGVGYSGLEG